MIKVLIKFVATFLSGPLLQLYFSTIRVREWQKKYVYELRHKKQTIIFLLWHENMFVPLYTNRYDKVHVLVSQHFDGEIISRVLHSLGFRTVRGSSTRGGFEAFLGMRKKLGKYDIAITPDGPRGPRRNVKLGAVKLASETGNVVIPVGLACSRYKRLKSWDKFLLIYPFSKCEVVYGKPYHVNQKLKTEELKLQARQLEKMLNQLDETAQKCLEH